MSKKTTETLEHRDYLGSIEFSVEDRMLFGEVLFIRDTIIYQGRDIDELIESFTGSVDQYLEDCETLGRDPNKTFGGTFNVRVGPKRHRELACLAYKQNDTINGLINNAIDDFVEKHETEEKTAWRASLEVTQNTARQAKLDVPFEYTVIEGGR